MKKDYTGSIEKAESFMKADLHLLSSLFYAWHHFVTVLLLSKEYVKYDITNGLSIFHLYFILDGH